MQRIMPYILYEDVAAALDWLKAAFGFTEWLRYMEADRRISHAEMRLGESAILLGGPKDYQSPSRHGHVCQYVVIEVEDVDKHFERAKRVGATITQEPKTQPWGDRDYRAKDLEGHLWFIEQHVRDVSPAEWVRLPH